MDELIGTGDNNFTRFAANKLDEYIEKASIIVIASHSRELIMKYCNRGLLLHNGKMIEYGSLESVFDKYEEINKLLSI